MAAKLFGFGGGVDEFAKAIPAAIKGYRDSKAQERAELEFQAKMAAEEDRKKRQARQDRMNEAEFRMGLDERYEVPAGAQDPLGLLERGELKRRKGYLSDSDRSGLLDSLRIQKLQEELGQKKRQSAREARGEKLGAQKALQVQEGAIIPSLLEDVEMSIEENESLFGPFEGTARANNPYDQRAQTIDAELRASSQAFGRYMEGGVLRKEDEEKYRKMFPQLSDTKDVAKAKLAVVKRLLSKKYNSQLKALEGQGYNLEGLNALPEPPRATERKSAPDQGNPWEDF